MEIDEIERNEDDWNPTPLKNIAIVSIVFSAILAFLMFLVVAMVGMLEAELAKVLKESQIDMTIEEYVSLIRVGGTIFAVLFVVNIVGSAMMMKKNPSGWIVFLVANCIIMFFFFFSMVGGDLISTLLFILYLTLTIFGGKHRYKKKETFENYTN